MTRPIRQHPANRRAARTLQIISALYVAVGFFLAVPAALRGDRLSAFLGFLIVSGALVAAAIGRILLRLTDRITALSEGLAGLDERLERIEHVAERLAGDRPHGPPVRHLDLAAIGRGNPSILAAASLDRDVFPRLVTILGNESAVPSQRTANSQSGELETRPEQAAESPTREAEPSVAVTTKNLLREWKLGLRKGDLAACRAVYAALVAVAHPADLKPMTLQLARLADSTERLLRKSFAQYAHDRDYAGMIMVGETICKVLADRPVAADFLRLKPHLLLLREHATDSADTSTLRVVQ